MKIYLYAEEPSRIAELATAAKTIAADADITALVTGSDAAAAQVAALDIACVCHLGDIEDRMVDDYVPTMAAVVEADAPDMVLVGASVRGRAMVARLAARLGTSAVVNAKTIAADGTVTHVVYGGGAVRTEHANGATLIATIPAGAFEAAAPREGVAAPIETPTFVTPAHTARVVASRPKASGGSDIMSAKKVVGVGRGFFTRDDLAFANDLAGALDATCGYSRPVTEVTPPIVENEPYIGVSGIAIKPDLYLAVAISGQTQHTSGVLDAKTIVCINKDADAPMFKLSDYGIVGDYKQVIPAVVSAINAEKSK